MNAPAELQNAAAEASGQSCSTPRAPTYTREPGGASATVHASPGRLAYEEDVRRCPNYPDGGARRGWDQLCRVAQWSWERNPTPRDYPATRAA